MDGKKLYFVCALYVAKFLSKIRFSHIKGISLKLPVGTLPFSLLEFLHEHKNDIKHLKCDLFEIPELNYVLSINENTCSYISELDRYFREKKRMHFFNLGGNIYVRIKEFVFILPFPYGVLELVETFFDESYGGLDVHNGTVIDIGAFIGDTAIYFASRGAKKIVAFEPAPPLYRIAIKNVRMNKMDNVISIRNEAVGERYDEVTLKYKKSWPGGSSLLNTGSSVQNVVYYPVKMVPFSDIVYELGYVDLVKVDCEGYEHKIFLNAYVSGSLKNVENIIVEVHGNPNNIISLLKKSSYKITQKSLSPYLHLLYACKSY